MAIVFELYIECLEEAANIAKHFTGLEFSLLTGKTVKWQVTRELGPSDKIGLGVVIYSHDLTRSGICSLQDALETTESGLRLYQHLKLGPDFEFARVGIEAESITMASLPSYLQSNRKTGRGSINLHCIVRERLYEKLGRPHNMLREFRPGYRWNIYHGEHYLPLTSPDQGELNEVCRKLFPELFQGPGWWDL